MDTNNGVGALQHAHVVSFYDSDAQLTRSVAAYLREGSVTGEVAVMIATPEHHASLVELDPVLASGVIRLDAAASLREFMIDGAPDPVAFEAFIGTALRRAAERGRVRAYGEMVALLWEQGNVTGALALEELWNGLLEELGFTLFCAYPSRIFDERTAPSFRRLCGLHTRVLADEASSSATENDAAERTFPRAMKSPAAARHFLVDTLRRWGHTSAIDDASIVVTELATNAVLHARSSFKVVVAVKQGIVRIAVSDESRRPPVSRPLTATTTSGRGLVLIGAVASRWGVEQIDEGKYVWAELTQRRSEAQ